MTHDKQLQEENKALRIRIELYSRIERLRRELRAANERLAAWEELAESIPLHMEARDD